jgi:uncharacterized repeat protein (TIGR03803 family)
MRKPLAAAAVVTFLVAIAAHSHAQTESILHSFSGGDGSNPSGGLIQASDGNFYGGTTFGGSDADGVIYQINSTGSAFQTIYSFTNGADGGQPEGQLLLGSDGYLYGATVSTVFKMTTAGAITTLAEPGGNPTTIIQASDGNYYFTTSLGSGIYKITASTGEVTKLASAPGFGLYSLIQASDGNLYATEMGGGTGGDATIFKCTLAGVVTVLYTFPSTVYPSSALIEGADGQLYGTVGDNTQATAGQIYKVSTTTGNYTTIATIPNSAGYQVPGTLLLASDGNYYALAQNGTDSTSLVKMTPGGTLSVPIVIANVGGLNDALIQGSDGAFYGTGSSGGSNSDGAVFKVVLSPALTAPVTLSLGANSIVQGKSTTLSWSVSGAYSASSGYCVATSNDPEWSGVKPTSGEITLTPSAVGSFTYTLTCGGSITNSVTLTVTSNGKVNTTTSLTVSPNPVTIGATETLTATVTPATGETIPSGTVTFAAAGTTLGTATLNGSGVAVLSGPTTGQRAGTYPVTATYNGNSSFNTSVSPAVNLTLTTQIATTVTVAANPTGVVEGGSITVSATVTPASGSGTPSGSVKFSAGSLELGIFALNSSGVAQFTGSTSGIAPGTYTITADYEGSSTYLPASGTVNVVVQWPTTTTLAAVPNPVVQGGSITLTATVARTGSSGIATGTVTFQAEGMNLGTATLSGGTASVTQNTSSVPPGHYEVTATYNGDTNDGASTSSALEVTVKQ